MSKVLCAALGAAFLVSVPLAPPAMAQPAQAVAPVRLDKARIDAALAEMVSSGRAVGVSALVWK
ncbi:MAG: serine hydrolase, partial [Phenylobacterium sp.]